MYRNAVIALLLAGAGTANAGDECFCPVLDGGSSGACGGSEYKRVSTGIFDDDDTGGLTKRASGELRCQELCAEEPDRCKGFAWFPQSGDNCYLYDSVPDDVDADEDASCYGLTGEWAGFTELEKCEPDGGKCDVQVYSGTSLCGGTPPRNEPYCIDRDGVTKASTLEECKEFCDSRGNLCQGFDFDADKARVGSVSCFERNYTPRRAYDPNRNDYTNWFCHTRDCDCGTPIERYECPSRAPSEAPLPTGFPTYFPTGLDCEDDADWIHITKGGKEKGCAWVGGRSSRCKLYGRSGCPGEVVDANEACPAQCSEDCQ